MSVERVVAKSAVRASQAADRPGPVVTAGVVAAGVLVGAICLALMAANPDTMIPTDGGAAAMAAKAAARRDTVIPRVAVLALGGVIYRLSATG